MSDVQFWRIYQGWNSLENSYKIEAKTSLRRNKTSSAILRFMVKKPIDQKISKKVCWGLLYLKQLKYNTDSLIAESNYTGLLHWLNTLLRVNLRK